MSTRLAPVALVVIAFVALGCAANPAASMAPPIPPIGAASPASSPPATAPPSPRDPNQGDVKGVQAGAPELVIESAGPDSLRITDLDGAAKAWRIAVASRDSRDRLEIVVETGDVVPGIRVDEIVAGRVVGSDDLTRMPEDPTVLAGGCHRTLEVCYSSDEVGVREGQGIAAILTFRDPKIEFSIVASSATWPGEPFILGPWHDSAPFQSWVK